MRLASLVRASCFGLPLFAAVAAYAAQDPAPAHDLRVELRAGEPLLAELRFEVQLAAEASSGSKAKKLEFRHETRLDYVDELVARDQPAAGDLDVRRKYLRWDQDVAEGRGKPKPADNSFAGAQALITRRGSELGLELIDRLAPQAELEQLLRHSGSVIWPAFPASARAGDTFQVDPTGLVSLILGDAFKARSPVSTFTLRAVDAEGVATVDGPLTAMVEDAQSRGTFEGALTLALDTRGRCVRSVEWKGKALLSLESAGIKLGGGFEARLEVQVGEAARKALERKLTPRSVPRALAKAPVTFELPSHWYSVESEDAETFRTTLHGAEAPVTLELSFFDVSSEEFASVVDQAVGKLEKEFRLSGLMNVPSPLGKGRSMRFQSKSESGAVHEFLMQFFPCGKSRMMRVRLVGSEKAFDVELRQWPDTLRTFELAK